jgi:hypothetical protein
MVYIKQTIIVLPSPPPELATSSSLHPSSLTSYPTEAPIRFLLSSP